MEFTWTREEALGLYRVLYRRGQVTVAAVGVIIGLLLWWAGSDPLVTGCLLLLILLLLGRTVLMPRRLWKQQHPGASGTHRYTWNDDSIRWDTGVSSVEGRAGSVTRVETPPTFVVVRYRAPGVSGIPARCFMDDAQRDDFLRVAGSLAASERSVEGARQDRQRNLVTKALCVGFALVVMGLSIVRSALRDDAPHQPEFDAATERWAEAGPASYELSYTIEMEGSGSENCRVLVVEGEIASAVPLDGGECPNTEQGPSNMEDLFEYVRGGLAREPASVSLDFDPQDGHLIHVDVTESDDYGDWSITVTEVRPLDRSNS